MGVFKLYDCDVGVTVRGQNYDFTHVDSVTVEDPRRTRLTRGVNATNKTGIAYTEGVKEACTVTVPVIALEKPLFDLLTEIFNNKERVDFYCVSRSDGSNKYAKNAVLSQTPQQLTLDDSPEAMNTSLSFESFDVGENHKA